MVLDDSSRSKTAVPRRYRGQAARGRIFSNKINPADFGSTTNVINGFSECGRGSRDDGRVADRIGFFERYCRLLEVSTGDYLDCNKSVPFYTVAF